MRFSEFVRNNKDFTQPRITISWEQCTQTSSISSLAISDRTDSTGCSSCSSVSESDTAAAAAEDSSSPKSSRTGSTVLFALEHYLRDWIKYPIRFKEVASIRVEINEDV